MSGDQQAEATDGLSVHSLFVGSRDGREFPDADRQAVIEATASVFVGFTVMDADGYFRGRSVATMVIKLGTNDIEAVISLARRLGALLASNPLAMKPADDFTQLLWTDPPYGSGRIYSNLRSRHHAEAAKQENDNDPRTKNTHEARRPSPAAHPRSR